MRQKTRNFARNYRFSQPELDFYVIIISYLESTRKTDLNEVPFNPI